MQYLLSGHSLELDRALCNGCGRCLEVCPHAVFSLKNHKAEIVNRGQCMQCGACRRNCPPGAVHVSSGVGCAALIVSTMRRGSSDGASCECR
jgi:ferredoxin